MVHTYKGRVCHIRKIKSNHDCFVAVNYQGSCRINSKQASNVCNTLKGSRDGAVVRAVACHQCAPGSIPGVICGSSLLLILYSAPRGFSPGIPIFPSPQKPSLLNSNSILESTGISNEFVRTPDAPWVNKLHFQNYIYNAVTLPQKGKRNNTTRTLMLTLFILMH